MSTSDGLLFVSLCALIAVCLLAIFTQHFNDNLAQRIGLILAAFGATIQAFAIITGHPGMWSASIIIHGAAVYAVGTLAKIIKQRR